LAERRLIKISPSVRRIMRLRSIATLSLFAVAAVVALKYPLLGLGICISCLIVYLKARSAEGGESNISFDSEVTGSRPTNVGSSFGGADRAGRGLWR
jgi:hypothetical protein